jgi:hypothetical protein
MGMKGMLAVCSKGYLGVITQDERQAVLYKMCDNCRNAELGDIAWPCTCEGYGEAFVGIHLSAGKVGEPWSSRNPQVLGDATEVAKAYQRMKEGLAGYPPVDPDKM